VCTIKVESAHGFVCTFEYKMFTVYKCCALWNIFTVIIVQKETLILGLNWTFLVILGYLRPIRGPKNSIFGFKMLVSFGLVLPEIHYFVFLTLESLENRQNGRKRPKKRPLGPKK
jgi:hypothetical protein